MEINELEKHCNEQLERLPKTSKMYEEHLLTLAIIETNKKYFEESEKKDKIIDLMAEYLADIDFDECCAEIPEPCFGCSWEDYEPHTQCIKEYFKRKVENGKNNNT